MCKQRLPLGNAACATRLVSSGAEGGSCRCNDIGALNWMRTLQSRKSGHDSTSLKLYFPRERLKRIWIRSSTNRSCARVAGRDLSCVRRWGSRCNPNIRAPLRLIVGTELAVLLGNGTRERRQVKSDRAKFRLVREIRSGLFSELRIRHQCHCWG